MFRYVHWIFSLLFVLSIANCSKVPKPADGEFVMGHRPYAGVTYYSKNLLSQVSAVNINLSGTKALKLLINNNQITEEGEVELSKIRFTEDKTYLTVYGTEGIFSKLDVAPEKVSEVGFVLPDEPLEFLCLASPFASGTLIATTQVKEVRILRSTNGYRLVGVNGANSQPVYSTNPLFQKTENASTIDFIASGVGNLKIQKNNPYSEDPSYFGTTVSLWPGAGNLVCHVGLSDPSETPAVTPLSEHRAFVTETTYQGNLGGLAGADAKCALEAANGSQTSGVGGVWRAILSDSTTNARDRIKLTPGVPLKDTSFTPTTVSNLATNLWSGMLQSTIGRTANGVASGDRNPWSGTNSMGNKWNYQCSDWTSNQFGNSASYGSVDYTNMAWIDFSSASCSHYHAIYCINSEE